MPARVARSNVSAATPKSARNKNRKRNLDAFSIASHSTKDKRKVARHRLGEVLDEGPRQKRRKVDDEDEDEDDEDGVDDDDGARKVARRQRRPDDDSAVEYGSDSSGNEWVTGGLAEDDDDSDLDSDEAFGESDEERFEGFTFRGSTKSAKKTIKKVVRRPNDDADVDLSEGEDEEEDEEDDDFGEEGVDLATMLDDNDEDDEDVGSDEGEDDGDSGDDESESASDEDDEEGADDEERVARMRDRLELLDNAGKSAVPLEDVGGVISVEDLLADLDPAARSQFSSAFKTKKKSAKASTLAAPLPKRQQDKLNRELATVKAKEQLDRWRDTVMKNRRAEFLSFPLKGPDDREPVGKEKFIPAAPRTDLERNIQRIMEESGMSANTGHGGGDEEETALLKAEELATNKLPIEEVERRRTELRRARELLFREEIKAKRIAKIKSKSYRRVHRKERERQAQKEREEAEAEGIPMAEHEADHFDRKRAEDRMSTKHRESKWAKSLKATNRTVWDENARDSVHDQARRNEELKQRIAGKEVYDGEASDIPSEDSDEDEDDDNATALRQLRRLKQDEDHAGEKGIANMGFMRASEARKRAQNDEDVARMRKDLAIADGDEGSESEIDDQGLGRAVFGPRAKEGNNIAVEGARPEMEEADNSEDEAERRELAERGIATTDLRAKSAKPALKSALKNGGTSSGPLARGPSRDSEGPSTADSNAVLYGDARKKSAKDKARQRASDQDDLMDMDIDISTVSLDKNAKKSAKKAVEISSSVNTAAAPDTNGWQTVPFMSANGSDHNSDGETIDQEDMTITSDPRANFQSRAFASEDVASAFRAEKDAAEASEDEKEVSTHLPGWGSWTGEALPKSIRRANARQKHNPLYKTKLPGGVNREDRRDKGRDDLIISEKQDRKGKMYLAPVLPHEYLGQQGGKTVYERSLRMPMGPEWSTKEVFQRNTRPRVVVKKGTVIEALDKPLL